MAKRDTTSVGAPCWVDTFQPDPEAAAEFYGALMGWTFEDPAPMPGGLPGVYLLARSDGRLVAGIGQTPPAAPPSWNTYIRVAEIEGTLAQARHAAGHVLVGPLDAGDRGRVAILTDATGVPFGLWQPGTQTGVELANAPSSWAMSSLHTPDVDQAQEFYGSLFGWRSEPGTRYSTWRLTEDLVALATPTDGTTVPAHWSVNFAVPDADATAGRAEALGGKVLMAPMDTPGLRNAVISDPYGAVIAVSAARH